MRVVSKDGDNIISWSIILIPLFWILGVKFVFFQVSALIILLLNIKNKSIINRFTSNRENKLFVMLLMGFILSNIIAIIINPMGFKASEFISTFYHLSYWGSGIIITIYLVNSDDETNSFKAIKNAIYILAIFQVIIFIISIMQWNIGDVWKERHGLIYNLIPFMSENTFLSEVTSINLSFADWVNGSAKYRFNGFYIYPATAGITTFYILCYLGGFNKLRVKKYNDIIKYFTIITLCICIYLTRSRMVYLSIIVGFLFTSILLILSKKNFKYIIYTIIGLVFISIILIFSFDIIDKTILARPESSIDRFSTYIYSIKTALKYPFFGVGDKFAVEGVYLLIGSHSTYTNILVRSGFIGLLFFLSSLIVVFVKILNNKKKIGCIKSRNLWFVTSLLFFTTCIWMATEEIDWPSITIFMFFINIAIIFSFDKIATNFNELAYKNIKICFPTSSGGHLTHLLQIKDVWENKERFWVTFKKIDAESALRKEKVYWCYYPTNRNVKNLLKNTFLAIKIIFKERPDLIISTGAAPAIPFFYIGKIFGAKLIYIEVYDRIDLPTLSGKIIYPICDEFIIQWEEQRKYYKDSKLLGGLF
ncbi:MAG: hypothetical protein GX214_09485 [Clostridiales bacterium]|nr:hypothetical protein [Clostridiales bacterium]